MKCSDCVNCKVSFETRVQPAYFQNGGMCPPVVKKLVHIHCAKYKDTGVFFLERYNTIEDFENSAANGQHTTPCKFFESDSDD